MSDLESVIEGRTKAKPTTRARKPKWYGDLLWNSQARVGDVVYMPSNPDVKMTVNKVPRINHAAHIPSNVYTVGVQWLDQSGQITMAELNADTLLRD